MVSSIRVEGQRKNMKHLGPLVLFLLTLLFVVLPSGILLYLVLQPCPYTPLRAGPGVEVACGWWEVTCLRCT